MLVPRLALVRVLREEVDCWLEQGRWVVLELAGLKALSPAGLELVHSWQERPVELRRMPVFIGSLIALFYGPQGLQAAPIQGLEPTLQPLPKA